MIYLNSVLGGPELKDSPADRAITALARAFHAAKQPEDGSLDVVFHVPGGIVKPDFSGTRSTKFSKKEKIQMIEIPVPPELVYADGLKMFLLEKLREAVEVGERKFRAAGLPYPKMEYLHIIDLIVEKEVH